MSPKRLEKILPKFLKALKAQDRVLLVGTTRRPFDANLKPFCKVYQKIIMIPRPDYASRFGKYFKSLWQLLLLNIHVYCLVIIRIVFKYSLYPRYFSVLDNLSNTGTRYPKDQILRVEAGKMV